jgi:hypothetical protein
MRLNAKQLRMEKSYHCDVLLPYVIEREDDGVTGREEDN